MGRSKFPGKPSKLATKKRIRILSASSTGSGQNGVVDEPPAPVAAAAASSPSSSSSACLNQVRPHHQNCIRRTIYCGTGQFVVKKVHFCHLFVRRTRLGRAELCILFFFFTSSCICDEDERAPFLFCASFIFPFFHLCMKVIHTHTQTHTRSLRSEYRWKNFCLNRWRLFFWTLIVQTQILKKKSCWNFSQISLINTTQVRSP